MQITRISIANFMGVHLVELLPKAPLLLIAGENGAGKSSILEGARAALVDEVDRIKLKKEFGALVTEGEKAGSVLVEHSAGRAAFSVPTGKRSAEGELAHPALPFVLDPHRFATLDEAGRRAFLFQLLGVTTEPADLARRLVDEMGCDAALVEAIEPKLVSGFDAACKHAKEEVSTARGAWKGVTGETYGEKKAEGWRATPVEPVSPSEIEAAQARAGTAEAANLDAQRSFGAVEEQAKQYADAQARKESLSATAEKIDRIRDKLARDENELATWKAKLDDLPPEPGAVNLRPPMACPECASLLDHRDGGLHRHEPAKGDDADTAVKRAEWKKAVALYEKSVATGKTDLAAAERAKVELADLEAMQPVEAGAVTAAREAANVANGDAMEARRALHELTERRTAAERVEATTAKAAEHHAEVLAWAKLADALSPAGLPVRIVAEALSPFNTAMAAIAARAGWMVPLLGADMGLTASGRQYRLLCESERWRADAVIALAIAELSGIRLVMLDRFDVLHPSGRVQAIRLLAELVDYGTIEQAVVAGTLKGRPSGLPPQWEAIWIENGYVFAEQALDTAA